MSSVSEMHTMGCFPHWVLKWDPLSIGKACPDTSFSLCVKSQSLQRGPGALLQRATRRGPLLFSAFTQNAFHALVPFSVPSPTSRLYFQRQSDHSCCTPLVH